MANTWIIAPNWMDDVSFASNGTLPTADDNSIDSSGFAFNKFSQLLYKSANAGTTFSNPIVSTYALLMGKPKRMISYDINWANGIERVIKEANQNGIDFDFRLDTFSNTITFYFKEEMYATFYRIKFID